MHRAVFASLLIVTASCGSSTSEAPDATTPDAPAGDAAILDGATGDAAIPDGPTADAPGADAALPDAAPPLTGELEHVDWRATRGAAMAATSLTLPRALDLWAVHGGGFVTRSSCAPDQGCTFAWHDDAGGVVRRRERMTATTVTTTSPDGRRALLLAIDEIGPCDTPEGRFFVAAGTLQLLDLATGEAAFELALRTNFWSAHAFTPGGGWFFLAPNEDDACVAARFELRSAVSPFAPSPGLGADLIVEAVDAGRWFVLRNHELGVVDPGVAGSFVRVGDDTTDGFDSAGGWIHAYQGFAFLVQEVVSLGPAGERRTTQLRDEDWFPAGAWGRWVRACGHLRIEEFLDCRVVDVLGEVAPVDFRVTHAPDHRDDTVLLGRDGAVVFVGPVGEGPERAVYRIDLATGRRETLHEGDARLLPLGDGAAAILLQDTRAWLVEADREELLADDVSSVVTSPSAPRRPRVRQDDVALFVLSSDAAHFRLRVLDLRSRRLATLSDRLFFAPRQDPPHADGGCGQPLPVRRAGVPGEVLFQDAEQLFFVEEAAAAGQPATLWMLPIDLSAPPRRVAELEGHPTLCHAPLTSPDGRRVAFAEEGSDGTTTRITLATP